MSSGFISEAEIAEQRKLRQEEWERVRSADAPIEAPEETYDSRTLFERLQESKKRSEDEYQEAHKLKHMIKGLDDDEAKFLDLVDQTKLEEQRKINLEEEKEMRDFKIAVASLHEKSLENRLKQVLKNPEPLTKSSSSRSGRNSQFKLLAGVIVKKSTVKPDNGSKAQAMKRKHSEPDSNEKGAPNSPPAAEETLETSAGEDSQINVNIVQPTAMKCIGILPGMGSYDSSSDSESSSDIEHEPKHKKTKYDILGREIVVTTKEAKESG